MISMATRGGGACAGKIGGQRVTQGMEVGPVAAAGVLLAKDHFEYLLPLGWGNIN